MPRPLQPPMTTGLTESQINAAYYERSPEHKAFRWWGGLPGKRGVAAASGSTRQRTTICPKLALAERDEATAMVREALRLGQFQQSEAGKLYPKHIWYQDQDGQLWHGYAINQQIGSYKGWPVEADAAELRWIKTSKGERS